MSRSKTDDAKGKKSSAINIPQQYIEPKPVKLKNFTYGDLLNYDTCSSSSLSETTGNTIGYSSTASVDLNTKLVPTSHLPIMPTTTNNTGHDSNNVCIIKNRSSIDQRQFSIYESHQCTLTFEKETVPKLAQNRVKETLKATPPQSNPTHVESTIMTQAGRIRIR